MLRQCAAGFAVWLRSMWKKLVTFCFHNKLNPYNFHPLQTTLLESMENNDRRVLVATTHLFFHPKANLIRIVQTEVVLKHLETLLDAYEAQVGKTVDQHNSTCGTSFSVQIFVVLLILLRKISQDFWMFEKPREVAPLSHFCLMWQEVSKRRRMAFDVTSW